MHILILYTSYKMGCTFIHTYRANGTLLACTCRWYFHLHRVRVKAFLQPQNVISRCVPGKRHKNRLRKWAKTL